MVKHIISFAIAIICSLFAINVNGQTLKSNRTFAPHPSSLSGSDGRIMRSESSQSKVRRLPKTALPDLRASITVCPGHEDNSAHWGAYNVFTMERLRYHQDLSANFGGTLLNDGKYFTTLVELDGPYITYMECNIWDTTDKDLPYRNVATEVRNMVTGAGPAFNTLALALCTDYLSGLVYGIFYSDDMQSLEFATLDVEGFMETKHLKRNAAISKIPWDLEPASMSCASDGTLYMIDINGRLYTINKSTGEYKFMASTGMASPYYTDGAIDPKTDIYYFFHLPNQIMDMWEIKGIDLRNNYKIESVAPAVCEFGGAYISDRVISEDVPGMPENVSANFPVGSLTGTISFSVPELCYNGNRLNGDVSYFIYSNEKMIATGSTSVGADVSANVSLLSEGSQRVIVYLENEFGKSLNSTPLKIWGGYGQPLPPAEVKAEADRSDNTVTLTWDAVEKGVLDGYVVPGEITYTVKRLKSDIFDATVADGIKDTSVIDHLNPSSPTLTEYRYEVIATFRDNDSEVAFSNMVPVGYILPPYQTGFDRPVDKDLYTIIDGGNDGFTWDWSDYYKHLGMQWDNGGKGIESDEWLISQPVMLKAGHAYSYKLEFYSYNSFNALQLFMSSSPEVPSMKAVSDRKFFTASNITPRELEVTVIPESDGLYYFGLHHNFGITYMPEMPYSMAGIELTNLEISEGHNLQAPNAVTDIIGKPQYDGSNKVDITFTTPSKNVNGGALDEITKVEVYRDGALVHTIENPGVGTSVTFRNEAPENNNYVFSFVPYNSHGKGYSAEQTIHVGVNRAMAPTNVVLREDPDNEGYMLMTWTPVAKDINGYDIDPSLITYAITTRYEVIHYPVPSSNPECRLKIAPDGTQDFYQFYVGAVTNGYIGGSTLSNFACIGTPDELPYLETFEGGLTASKISNISTNYDYGAGNYWYVRITDGYTNMPEGMDILEATSQDEGDGLIGWHPEYGRPYNTFRTTGKIALGDTDDVVFSYYYYAVPGMPDYSFYNYLICEGETIQLNEKINIADADERGWKEVRIPLKNWKGKTVQLGWYVECDAPKGFYENDYMWYGVFMMDNIQVRRWTDKDLNIRPVSAPSSITINSKGTVDVDVVNEGRLPSAPYKIELLRDGKLFMDKEMPILESGERATASFEIAPDNFWKANTLLSARVIWDEDQQEWNNTTKDVPVEIIASILPGVTDLNGEIDYRDATLTWTAHSNEPRLVNLTEDCEELGVFSLEPEAFGNWTVVDRKEPGAQMRSRWYDWPHAQEQQAWMVFDTEIYTNGYINFSVDGSRKKFVSWDCTNMASDNWLISPLLSGEAQTISFDAATWGYNGYERMQVLYSSTDNNPDNFVMLDEQYLINAKEDNESGDVTVRWNKIEVSLPAGAKYFAIRNLTNGTVTEASALMVDNIKCSAYIFDNVVDGYNVYRDGERLNDELVSGSTFVDSNLWIGTYTYHVETVYTGNRLSRLSNPLVLTVNEFRLPAGLRFEIDRIEAKIDEPFTAPTLYKDSDAPAIYSSNHPEIASVDQSTGVVTLLKKGTATIKAATNANETYLAGEAKYTLTVTDNSGVDSVTGGFKVLSVPGYIVLENCEDRTVTISNASGMILLNEQMSVKTRRIPVPAGIYLVSTNTDTFKVIVK